MTPAARLSAAMDVLDRVAAGGNAEQALTQWARASRFAGSGDRAAVRDLVFTALRRRHSHAALGGGESGRALILGALREAGTDPAALFTGEAHAPAPLSAQETAHLARPVALEGTVALDCPDWLAPQLQASLGADFAPVMQALRDRAPVYLRVNTARGDRAAAQASLAAEGIATRPAPLAETALEVTGNERRIRNAQAYRDGLVELQDAASQALVAALPVRPGQRVLDYCAGGGGKVLALAARARQQLFAHDADPGRMRDLPARAARAGTEVQLLTGPEAAARGPYDLVLLDVPCSGSGAWRRAPEAKWRLTPERLRDLQEIQSEVLDKTMSYVAPGGCLAYATCSVIEAENGARIKAFLAAHPDWRCSFQRRFTPLEGGDGFYLALLTRR
ncbi:SAM-dependent methlyltransferase [Defluviimonas sp. 20V17]|uniref:16S rRNA (Cytosine967-C5)-methyltransferase n=1 Tax=Allgaiera indica TaxID=765699 RepID=A0AAN4UQ28_9RHOB|nr:RsmB/NOP family class I SAM-dependent RNA methyltransferase [Allgaiera indica]KDB04560.1 SAM-dependent methlyltransferase [Defluviimonas sp. 20V17]GHD99675.1 SAM-dependent methyltransferase [Allgaiera indica]SDW20682.1 16S rRNA (cytosine967-C5)-methyltransferase [Allgaiera indica]